MPLDSAALDAALDDAIRALHQLRDACGAQDVPPADAVISRLAEVRSRPEPEQRVLLGALLVELSTGWRGYDDASPALQAVMERHNAAVSRIVRAASDALLAPDGVDFLVAHAADALVDRVLPTIRAQLSTASWHRILLARPGRSEQRVGDTHLLFLANGLLVVVDGHHCHGPARPPIEAAVGQMSSPTRPGPRFIQLRDLGDRPLVLDLERMRATEFQRPKVARHNPILRSIDELGVVLGLGRSDVRYAWDELAWSPLRPFEG